MFIIIYFKDMTVKRRSNFIKKEWKKEKRHEKGGKVGKSLDFLKKT